MLGGNILLKLKLRGRAILATILITSIILGYLPIGQAQANQVLGTNLALGSPLLNNSFNNEQWDRWEIVAFGIFLSNFTYPLVDDYRTAFTNTNSGSKGSGFKALDFGTGKDPANHEVLKNILNYVISIQADTTNLREILVKWESQSGTGGETDGETDSYAQATINDFFGEEMSTKQMVPIFTIQTGPADDAGGKEVVFSFKDGWDVQMLSAWMSRVTMGDYRQQANSALDKMLDNKEPIYLDALGNIVTMNDGRPVVVFPAASNQHLTSDGRYNLLTSVILGGNYITTGEYRIVDTLEAENRMVGVSVDWWVFDFDIGVPIGYLDCGSAVDSKYSKYIKPGSTILLFDTAVGELASKSGNKGEALAQVLMSDINNKNTPVGFTVAVVGLDKMNGVHDRFKDLYKQCSLISTSNPPSNNRDKLTYIKMPGSKELKLFQNTIATTVSTRAVQNIEGGNLSALMFRRYINYVHKYITTGKVIADKQSENRILGRNVLINELAGKDKKQDIKNLLLYRDGNKINDLFISFVKNDASIGGDAIIHKSDKKDIKSWDDITLNDLDKAGYLTASDRSLPRIRDGFFDESLDRIVKIYSYNDTIKQASNVLSIRPGTEFGLLSPHIYLTYLDFYGVTSGRNHKFNTAIYDAESDILKVDITKMTAGTMMSEEEKRAKLLDYSFMLLDPEQGRQYRSDMAMSNFSDWIYRTYQKMVYGKSTEYYDNNSGVANRYSAGFLRVDNYSENFMTKWLIDEYSKYLLVLIGFGLSLIIVYGVITKRKTIWFLVTTTTLVTILILTPAFGEITPYITNNSVQNMFNDKMSYWAISESVTNANIEKESAREIEQLGSEDVDLSDLIRAVNIVHLDRALMVKNDISKKINESAADYEKVQSLQSARWLLPIIIRQFTADDKSSDYVYVPLADVYDNLSNLYWLYKPSDALTVQTQAARDMVDNFNEGSVDNRTDVNTKTIFYEDYNETSNQANKSKGMYNNIKISSDTMDYTNGPGWESLSRLKDDSDVVHTGAYILKDVVIPRINDVSSVTEEGEEEKDEGDSYIEGGYNTKELWDSYLEANKSNTELKESLYRVSSKMEQSAGKYNKSNPSSSMDESFGYLWYTESTFHYFYDVIKDTFDSGITVGTVAGELQGIYTDNRETIMHYSDTGKIRDFLDMQELFTNTIPYIYKVQMLTGGNNGKQGLLGDSKIESYALYEGMNKSWLFRSNWVTKMMTSEILSKESRVTDAEGNVHYVSNPMDPSTYPDNRPMIFSEAQMHALGLDELDLNIVELKILKVNEEVMNKWTLALNYVNIKGMTTDVLYKQMATDATTIFNREFSPTNKINSKKALYPNGIDLRSISFDSVMKMLMLNTTRDSSLIYGDTMRKVIDDSDIFTALALLLSAFLSALITPFVRNVLLGILLFLGIFSLISNIMGDSRVKLKITTAYIINHVLFLLMTIIYFLAFAVIVNSSYRDDVLNVTNVSFNIGVPVWIFFIIIIVNVAYIWGSCKIIQITVTNRHDLGFGVYTAWSYALADKISGAVNKISGGKYGKPYSNNTVVQNTSFKEMNVEGSNVKVSKEMDTDEDLQYENYSSYDYDLDSEIIYDSHRAAKIEEEIERGSKSM